MLLLSLSTAMGLAAYLLGFPMFAARAQAEEASPTPTLVAAVPMFMTCTPSTEDHCNVRSGPGTAAYPVVGELLVGQTAPALGRSPGGDWIQIEFADAPGRKGWVYSNLATLSPGILPIAEPPPTPVQPATATIDPTLAAQFNIVPTLTRLPTFTPPPPLTEPQFTDGASAPSSFPVSVGTVILALGILGASGLVLAILARR